MNSPTLKNSINILRDVDALDVEIKNMRSMIVQLLWNDCSELKIEVHLHNKDVCTVNDANQQANLNAHYNNEPLPHPLQPEQCRYNASSQVGATEAVVILTAMLENRRRRRQQLADELENLIVNNTIKVSRETD